MANKNWMVGDARWNPRERQRVEEQFRRHVRTKSNPNGRIQRESCPFCIRLLIKRVESSEEAERVTENYRSQSQFHHISYDNPFLGVWCCISHHRRIEHGTVTVHKRDVWDYSSIVAPLLRPKASAAMTAHHARKSRVAA